MTALRRLPTPLLFAVAFVVSSAAQNAAPDFSPTSAPLPPPRDEAYPGTLELRVDATDVDRRIFDVQERIPVAELSASAD